MVKLLIRLFWPQTKSFIKKYDLDFKKGLVFNLRQALFYNYALM